MQKLWNQIKFEVPFFLNLVIYFVLDFPNILGRFPIVDYADVPRFVCIHSTFISLHHKVWILHKFSNSSSTSEFYLAQISPDTLWIC